MLKNCWAIAAALLFLCGLAPGAAHAVDSAGSPYVVDVWEKDLPASSVLSVVQTRDGYLWMGTLHGLVRFDGIHFKSFGEADGLASSRIVHLFEDTRSNLWVGTESAGITLIRRTGEITNLAIGQGLPGGQLATACEDTNGTVWLMMANGGLARYWSNKFEVVYGQFRSVIAESGGPIWLGGASNLFGVVAPPGSTAMVLAQQLSVSDLKFLLASKTGGYWRLADGHIEKWNHDKRERDLGLYPWGATPVMAACEDNEGNLVIGTYGDGVYWFGTNGKFTHLLSELSHSSVLSLTFDREGNLWVGTNGRGLDRVKRKVFGVLPMSEGLVVQSVSPDKSGGLWIAYNGNRIDHWNNGTSQQFSLVQDPATAPGTYAKAAFVDKGGRVFAGISFGAGISGSRLFEFDSGKFVPSTRITSDISAIHQDRTGRLWIGTQEGLILMDGQNLKSYSINDGLPAAEVRAIVDDTYGNVWIGTSGGLGCLRDGHITAYRRKQGLPSEDISALLAGSDGTLWIGTRGRGLIRFFKDRFTSGESLVGNSISYLFEEGDNLWLGSNVGLMRVSKKSFDAYANHQTDSITCRVYVETDGLPTHECTEGSQPAACATTNGTLWFPTTRGLVFVNPSTLKTNLLEPQVVIESVIVDGRQQNSGILGECPSQIIVPPGRHELEIHYASLNLGAAERSRFKFRLNEKQKSPWTDDENGNRVAPYPKLPPGAYQFEVIACNEDGVWNSNPISLAVIVQPAFWQTSSFQAITVITGLLIIAGLVYYFSTQKLQRQLTSMRQQEALEKERARIARDLHDQLGANITQIALLGEMAGADKNLPQEVEDHAQQICQTARETTKSLDEIVWAVNPSNDTLDGLITYAGKYAQEYFALAGLRYRVDIPSDVPNVDLPPDVRHNVFLAFKESVNNVVKHAQATEVHTRLEVDEKNFTLEIEDNGRGPADAAKKTGRNGLRNMRKRMEDVGGSFSIEPAKQRGTVVRLTAPVKNR